MHIILLLCPILWIPTVIPQAVLDCNFETDFCNWAQGANGVEDDFDWGRSQSVNVDAFHSIPRTVTGTGFFAFAQGRLRPANFSGAKAALISPVIQNQINPGILEFVYWKTAAPPVLQVCIRDVGGSGPIQCVDTISGLGDQRWVRRQVTIPSRAFNFQIVIQASGFNSAIDLLGIDDLRYRNGASQLDHVSRSEVRLEDQINEQRRLLVSRLNKIGGGFPFSSPDANTIDQFFGGYSADLSRGGYSTPDNSANSVIPSPPRTKPQPPGTQYGGQVAPTPPAIFIPVPSPNPVLTPPPFVIHSGRPGACPAVACDFTYGLCQWYNDLKSNFDFKLKNRESRNPGMPQDYADRDSYVYVNGNTRTTRQRATLTSPSFIVPSGAYLQFDAFLSDSQRGRLSVYRNDPRRTINVLWAALGNIAVEGPGWHTILVPLPQGSIQPLTLSFVADQLTNGVMMGIGNVLLVDSEAREIGCASDTRFAKKKMTNFDDGRFSDPDKFVADKFKEIASKPRFYAGPSQLNSPPVALSQAVKLRPEEEVSHPNNTIILHSSGNHSAGNLVSFERLPGYFAEGSKNGRRPIIRAVGPPNLPRRNAAPKPSNPGKEAGLGWVLDSLPSLIALPFASRKEKEVNRIKAILAKTLQERLSKATEKMQELRDQRITKTEKWVPVVERHRNEMLVRPIEVRQSPVNHVLAPQTGYPLVTSGSNFAQYLKSLQTHRPMFR